MTKQREARAEISVAETESNIGLNVTLKSGAGATVVVNKSSPLFSRFAAYGIKSRLLAAVNSAKDDADAVRKISELDAAWDEGRWSAQPEAPATPKAGILVRAMAAIGQRSIEDAQVYVTALTKAQQATLRKVPTVAAKILELEAADRNAGEADGLLDDFVKGGAELCSSAET